MFFNCDNYIGYIIVTKSKHCVAAISSHMLSSRHTVVCRADKKIRTYTSMQTFALYSTFLNYTIGCYGFTLESCVLNTLHFITGSQLVEMLLNDNSTFMCECVCVCVCACVCVCVCACVCIGQIEVCSHGDS